MRWICPALMNRTRSSQKDTVTKLKERLGGLDVEGAEGV